MPNSRTWLYLGLGTITITATYSAIASTYETLISQNWLWLSLLILGGAIAITGQASAKTTPDHSNTLSRAGLLQALAQIQETISKISDRPSQEALRQESDQIAHSLEQNQVRIAVFGTTYSGKTAVIHALLNRPYSPTKSWQEYAYDRQPKRQIFLVDTPGLQERGAQGHAHELKAKQIAQAADLLVFVTSGDLTATEYQELLWLTGLGKQVILAFNKLDQYIPVDQATILAKLHQRVADLPINPISPMNIVAIAANPAPIKVRQYAIDADPPQIVKEWLESVPPNISPLRDRIEQILAEQWEDLLLQTTNWKVQRLRQVAQSTLQKIRHQQGQEIVVRYQWLNAGVIFANPLPAIDLVASAAINTQLLMELGKVYERPLRIQEAQKIAATIGEILLKIGCVEVATVAIASQVSYIFKTNAITYAIGGTIQGVSAAYLTHLGGISFLDYLDQLEAGSSSNQTDQNLENLTAMFQKFCQNNFGQMQSRKFLTDFVNGAMNKLASIS